MREEVGKERKVEVEEKREEKERVCPWPPKESCAFFSFTEVGGEREI